MRVAYEALAWGRHVSEYDHAWRLVEAADHPALGVCLDSFHILSRGTSLETIAAIPADKLFFLQLADAPHLVMDVLQWSRHYRCFPGQGGFDLAGVHPPRARRRVHRAALARGLQRRLPPGRPGADGGRRDALAAGPRGGLPGPRPRAGPAARLRVRRARGRAGVGRRDRSGPLHALGFDQAAQHRTKPVTLWRQGSARVLLNAGASPPTASPPSRSRASIRAARRSAPRRCSRRSSTVIAGRPRPTSRPSPPPTGPRSSSAAPTSASGELAAGLRRAGPRRQPAAAIDRAHRPRRAGPAVGLLRRGGALLSLGARARAAREPRARRTRRADPQPRGHQRRRQRAARAQRAAAGRRSSPPGRAAARRPRLRRRARGRPRHARARRRAARDPRELLRRPRGPHRSSSPDLIDAMRELGVLYDRDARRRVPALLHPDRRRSPVLRGRRAPRRLRRLRRRELAGPDGGAASAGDGSGQRIGGDP